MNWDKELDTLASRIGNRHQVPKEEVKRIIEHIWTSVREELYSADAPKILLHEFGSLTSSTKTVEKRVKYLNRLYKYGIIDEERLTTELDKLSNIYKRLQDEGR